MNLARCRANAQIELRLGAQDDRERYSPQRYKARRHHGACRSARTRSDVHAMLSVIVAVAAFAPPAARTSPHAARPVVQPLRAAQPLCKVRDPNDKVIYVGASPAATTPRAIPASHKRSHPASRTASRTAKPSPSATAPKHTNHPAARSTASRTARLQPRLLCA